MQELGRLYPLCALEKVASFLNGTAYDIDQLSDFGEFPIIRISNISDPESPYIRTQENLGSKFWIRRGDLLVSWAASFKSSLWNGLEGYLNQHISKVTENANFDRNYLRHAIEASFDQLQQSVVGFGMMHLRRSDFLGHEIPAPPVTMQKSVANYLDWVEKRCIGEEPLLPSELMEQRRIVMRIAELFRKVEEARRLRRQSDERAGTLIDSEITRLFDQGKKNGWVEKALGDYVVDDRYGTSEKTNDNGSGTPILGMKNIQNGRLDVRNTKFLHLTIKDRNRLLLRKGDIVVNRTNSAELVGKCAVFELEGEYGFASYLIRLRLHFDKAEPKLVAAYINSPAGRAYMFKERNQVTGQANVSGTKLKALPIALPGREEQCELVAYLDNLQAQVDRLKTLQAETCAELDALTPSILDKAFRGELSSR